MSEDKKRKIQKLKLALLEFLGANARHYGDLTRMEQSVEDLAQALNTRLDQLLLAAEGGAPDEQEPESPRERLAGKFLEVGALLSQAGNVDEETADEFETAIDLLDAASDFRRKAASLQDKAETGIVKEKRNKGS